MCHASGRAVLNPELIGRSGSLLLILSTSAVVYATMSVVLKHGSVPVVSVGPHHGGGKFAIKFSSFPSSQNSTCVLFLYRVVIWSIYSMVSLYATELVFRTASFAVSFKPGAIVYESVEGAPVELARRLAGRLKEWTGRTWLIAANGQGGGDTLIERQRKERAAEREKIEADPFIKAVLLAFPGAQLGEIKTIAPTVVTPEIPDVAEDDDED